MAATARPTPTKDELDELLLCARYGDDSDLADIKAFVDKYGESWLSEVKDDRGNTCLHVAGANGHEGEAFNFQRKRKPILLVFWWAMGSAAQAQVDERSYFTTSFGV